LKFFEEVDRATDGGSVIGSGGSCIHCAARTDFDFFIVQSNDASFSGHKTPHDTI